MNVVSGSRATSGASRWTSEGSTPQSRRGSVTLRGRPSTVPRAMAWARRRCSRPTMRRHRGALGARDLDPRADLAARLIEGRGAVDAHVVGELGALERERRRCRRR
jgi:hypothetical protein